MKHKSLLTAILFAFIVCANAQNIMKVHDVTAQVGEVITIELEIVNEDQFVGFNLDIPLPQGFEYVEGTAQLFRDDGHFFNFSILEGNIARMISAAIPTTPFSGNDGVIVSFDLETPQTEGSYTLAIVDAVIVDANGDNIMTGSEPGTVTLEEAIVEEYTLTVTIVGSGIVEVDGAQYIVPVTVEEGTVLSLETIADTGWAFDGWSGDLTGDASPANITMDEDKNITANFSIQTFTITATAGQGGNINPSGDIIVEYGNNQNFSVTADSGYAVSDVYIDDESIGAVSSYHFINVTKDHSIHAEFTLTGYSVTFIIENEHGETIPDAVVTLDQTENPPGDYVFEDVEPGDYSYTVTAENYFDASGEVEVIDQDVAVTVVMEVDDTGIAETQTPEITIFPNPVQSTLHVESNIRISQIQLLDMLGQRVMAQTVNDIHHELNVSGLKDGLYFIQVFTDRGMKTLRVQIIR